MPTPLSPIQLEGLTKHYGSHRGIDDLTLEARAGEVLGFLGPNGSGKTTTLRLLLGFLKPTSGKAKVLGLDALTDSVEIRKRVGYLPGDVSLYGDRTGEELVRLSLAVRGISDRRIANGVAESLDATMDRPIKKCSRGMRQKVAVVLALAHDPELLIMDEPASGLDPLAQRTLLRILRAEAEQGKTVFFSSHVLSEAEEVCDRVAILREGRLIALDSIAALRGQKYKNYTLVYAGAPPDLEGLDELEILWQREQRMAFRARVDVNEILVRLSKSVIEDLTIEEPSLEDVFLDYYRGTPS
jgi:ABC-2 type transport system ATP-binding protein